MITLHSEAFQWFEKYATTEPVAVLDIGGRDINGSVRSLFPGATRYTVLDILPGANVDIQTDAATWTPDDEYDVVVCAETFEHAEAWREICATAYRACAPGGMLIATMAGPDRPAHSGHDGSWTLYPDEYYGNIHSGELLATLVDCGWQDIVIDEQPSPCDIRAVARKRLDGLTVLKSAAQGAKDVSDDDSAI